MIEINNNYGQSSLVEFVEKSYELYKYRANNIDLTWCIQAVDVLEKHFKNDQKFNLLDIDVAISSYGKKLKKERLKSIVNIQV